MDDYAVAAILAVPTDLSGSDFEQFFNLIIEMYVDGDGPTSLDDFARAVGDREPGFGNAAERFRETLTSQGIDGRWADIAGILVREGGSGSNLVTLHGQYTAQLSVLAEQVPIAETYEGQAAAVDWETFRQENYYFWSNWDGGNWADWRAAFTGRIPDELRAELDPHVAWLDSLDPAGQMTYLRDSLGFAINYEAPPVAAEELTQEGLTQEELAPEATPEQLAQATDALLKAGETVPEEITPELAAEVFAEVPEAAQLSPEAIAEVMREVAAEMQV
jgi:hypothetical protein